MAKVFRSQEPVPESGVYDVSHVGHRLKHQVTILRGSNFPLCKKCGDNVRFRLVRPVRNHAHWHAGKDFGELLISASESAPEAA